MKICTKCHNNTTNRGSWCKTCRADAERLRRRAKGIKEKTFSKIKDGHKTCAICSEFKPLTDFSPAKRGKGMVSYACKPCVVESRTTNENRKKGAAYTKNYRNIRRNRWRALHRIACWESKHSVIVPKDGTVTDEFLDELYGTSHCYYCENEIPPCKRTADHIVSLSAGGSHSSSNLAMACRSCNSKKRDLSEQEFRRKLNDNKS